MSPFASLLFSSFFVHDTAPTEIYTLSLHDALPILLTFWTLLTKLAHTFEWQGLARHDRRDRRRGGEMGETLALAPDLRSEEHTSELQSRENLVCRLLLEKKKKMTTPSNNSKASIAC